VALRAVERGLILDQLYFADEVKNFVSFRQPCVNPVGLPL